MSYEDLRNVADRSAFVSGLTQSLLGDYVVAQVGERHRFEVDIPTQRLSFVGEDGRRLDVHAEMIGSVAPGPRSLLWGWAHPQGQGDDRFAIKRLGERFGLRELTTPEVPLDPSIADEDLDHEVFEVSHLAGLVAVEAIREGFYYSAPTGHGPRVVFWLRGLEAVPAPTMRTVSSRLSQIVSEAFCRDHRSGMLGVAEHLGWYLDWRDESFAVLSDPDGQQAEIHFDGQGRLSNLTSTLTQG